jgi:hypothetical protein
MDRLARVRDSQALTVTAGGRTKLRELGVVEPVAHLPA